MRARAVKDSIRHQKKLDEFIKAIKTLQISIGVNGAAKYEEEIRAKFRETLVKNNCLKEDDNLMRQFIQLTVSTTASFKQ